jgi:hypothetical protein
MMTQTEYRVTGNYLGREATVTISAESPEHAAEVALKFYRLTDVRVEKF